MNFPKLSILAFAALSASGAFASTFYICDDTDLISGKASEAVSQAVEVYGLTASVYEMAVYPGARKFPKHVLSLVDEDETATTYMNEYATSDFPDTPTVMFTLIQNGKVGALKTVSKNGTRMNPTTTTLFYCERQ